MYIIFSDIHLRVVDTKNMLPVTKRNTTIKQQCHQNF